MSKLHEQIRILMLVASAFVLLFSPFAWAQGCAGFNDVPASSASCPAIDWMASRGISLGCAPGMYCPQGAVSREQMALFLYRSQQLNEVHHTRDRTEQESETWTSNSRVCADVIPPKPYPRSVLAHAAVSFRYSIGDSGLRWPIEWQIQYSFVGEAPWYSANEMAYADTGVDWFYTSTDNGVFTIPANKTTVTSIRTYYIGVPVWGRCNVTFQIVNLH